MGRIKTYLKTVVYWILVAISWFARAVKFIYSKILIPALHILNDVLKHLPQKAEKIQAGAVPDYLLIFALALSLMAALASWWGTGINWR